MKSAKEKITTAVKEYKRLFPDEYKQFKKSNQITINKQENAWASTGSHDNLVERHLFDTPEKLHQAISRMLNEEELDWWNARGVYTKNFAAAKWFISTYPEFKVTKQF